MRPSVLAALGLAIALFVGAGTFVALDARLGASGETPAAAQPGTTPLPQMDRDEPEVDIEPADPDADTAPEAETAPPSGETTPRAPAPEPQAPAPQPRPQPAPRPQPQQPAPRPQPQQPVATPPAQPACDPAPLIRRITQLTVRDCPGHTDPDRKRACYAEIERLNSELEACSS